MKKDQETTTKMAAVEMVAIVRRRRVAADVIGTKIGNGVAAVESIAENTKSQADIAVEVEEGLVLNHIHIIHHLMTIRDLDPDRLPTKRNVRSRSVNTGATEKTTVEVEVEVILHLLLLSTM